MKDERKVSHWYALYTRPKFEKKVASVLEDKDIRAFLPTRSVVKQWSDRKKIIDEPLFPSYVFVYANSKGRYLSLQTHGVVRMVSFNGEPTRIPEEQIRSIYQILEHGYDPEPYQYFAYGDEVEIVSGPLRGLRGLYIEDRGTKRLVISVDAIQHSFAIELKRGQVKKCSPRNIIVKNTRPYIN